MRASETPPQSSTPNSTTSSSIGNSVGNSAIPSPAPSPAISTADSSVKSDPMRLQHHQVNSNTVYQNGPLNNLSSLNGALPKVGDIYIRMVTCACLWFLLKSTNGGFKSFKQFTKSKPHWNESLINQGIVYRNRNGNSATFSSYVCNAKKFWRVV